MRKFVSGDCGVIAARELVAFVDVKEGVAEIFQPLAEEFCVGESRTFGKAKIIGGPAPPSDGSRSADSRRVKFADSRSVGFELRMIIGREAGDNALGGKALAGIERQAELDLIFGGGLAKRILPGQFCGSGGIDLVAGYGIFPGEPKADDGEPFFGSERANEKALPALPVVNKLAADGAMHGGLSRASRVVGYVAEVVKRHIGAVFAEAIGKNAVGSGRAIEGEKWALAVERANALDRDLG